jgi:hypothetical protein
VTKVRQKKFTTSKKWECLPRWCGKLQLVTECDGLEFHDSYGGQKYIFCHGILYYYVKVWIISEHDYGWKYRKIYKKNWWNIIKFYVFLIISYSLNSNPNYFTCFHNTLDKTSCEN